MTAPIRTILLTAIAVALLCPEHLACQQSGSISSQEQTAFGLELPFERPVPLPQQVFETVRASDTSCDSAKKLVRSWFAASEVTLKPGELPGLVVKAENACLWGANIGPFWVFRNTGRGYALVLSTRALSVELLNSSTHEYRNIRTSTATATHVSTVLFKFEGGRYRIAARKTKPIR